MLRGAGGLDKSIETVSNVAKKFTWKCQCARSGQRKWSTGQQVRPSRERAPLSFPHTHSLEAKFLVVKRTNTPEAHVA